MTSTAPALPWRLARPLRRRRDADANAPQRVRPAVHLAGVVTGSVALGLAVAGVLALGLDSSGHLSHKAIMIPVIPVLGAVLLALAVFRFEALLLSLLVARDALDAFKGGGSLQPTVLVAGVFVLCGVVWLAAQRRRERLRPADMPLSIAGGLFLAVAAISTATSELPKVSAPELARLASVIMMLAVLERLFRDRHWIPPVLIACYCSLLVPALVALYQWKTHRGELIDGVRRAHGTFVHPNSLAMYLAFLIVMGFGLATRLRGTARTGLVAAIVLALPCLLFTDTRGAWIGTAVGVLVVAALRSKALLAAVVGSGILLVLVDSRITARFSDLKHSTTASGYTANSFAWRIVHWQDALTLAKGRPMTGIGLAVVRDETSKAAHNDYLRAYVETGLLGFVAYIGLIVTCIVVARRAYKRATTPLERGIATGAAGAVAAWMTMSIADNLITQSVVLWYFAVFIAAASAIGRPGRRSAATRDPVAAAEPGERREAELVGAGRR